MTDWLTEKEYFRISAHRGAVVVAPENSMEAFEKAIELGYGAVELDPRISADGTVYLLHDDDVSRTSNGAGILEYMTDEEIDALTLNTDNYPELENETLHIPRFEDVIALLSDSDLVVNVDCSKLDWSDDDNLEKIMGILEEYDMTQRCFMVMSDEQQRSRVHEKYPDLCLSWLFDPNKSNIDRDIARIREYPRAMLSVRSEYATQSRINAMNEAKIYYQVYNVDDNDRAKELKSMGVPMIETNTVRP